jgi:hypothetical protein
VYVNSQLDIFFAGSTYLQLLLASMNFWRFSLASTTSFVTSSSFPKISSTTYAVWVVSFSSVLCVSCFVIPCALGNSPITLSASFCNSSNFYTIFFCSTCIFSTSLYICLFASMFVIRSVGGRVLMPSLYFLGLLLFSSYSISDLLQLHIHHELCPNMRTLVAQPRTLLV